MVQENSIGIGQVSTACAELDYEAMAAELKKRIDANKKFCESVVGLKKSGSFHVIDQEDQRTLYTLFGGLSILITEQEDRYTQTIAKMEEKKA